MANYRKLAYNEVTWEWDDCTVSFTCICGASQVMVDGDGEPAKCEKCGREYRLVSYVEVKEPTKKGEAS